MEVIKRLRKYKNSANPLGIEKCTHEKEKICANNEGL